MSEHTWKDTIGHHWFDKHAREEMPLINIGFGNVTTPMKGQEHVQVHRDTKEAGRVGAVARFSRNRIIEGKGFTMFCE